MLLQLTVENFRSLRDQTTFSMLVPAGSEPPPRNYVDANGYRVLRAAALYGANASGKSNFFRALGFCQSLVTHGSSVGAPVRAQPFLLDPERKSASSRFEFELLIDEVRYSYGFEVDTKRVRGEWLFRTSSPDAEAEAIFERGDDEESPFAFGAFWGDSLEHANLVAKTTRTNQLFLTQAAEFNLEQLMSLHQWFSHSLITIGPSTPFANLATRLHEDGAFRDALSAQLANIDTGIRGLDTRTDVVEPFIRNLFKSEKLALNAMPDFLEEEGKLKQITIRTKRLDSRGKMIRFRAHDESDGTRRFMHLAPVLVGEMSDATFVIDELDRSLHTLLAREFVERFLDDGQQAKRQLIFTTHDTNLLTRELFPPEAVWFAEKDGGGGTALYSLAEFDQDQLAQLGPSLEAGYLAGRFGAIPFLADRARLGWSKAGE